MTTRVLLYSILCLAIWTMVTKKSQAYSEQPFAYRTVVSDLTIPWEIEFGPDGLLWVTERPGLFSRINIETGDKQVILDIRDKVHTQQETGMLGFAWHPNFADTPWVFVAYVGGTAEHMYRVVERYTFDGNTLLNPVEIFRFDPAAEMHQGCRLFIDSDRKLWVTMGDTPGGNLAVDDNSVVGKLLHMNLDGSVPADNPHPNSLMWTKGHRNIQGFVQLPNGTIWTSEHGNIIEDEVNLIVKGGNYGWPFIEGPADLPDEVSYQDTTGALNPKWSSGEITYAPCGLRYYNHDKFPRLKNSLLLTFLKDSRIMQIQLNEAGDSILATHSFLQRSVGRIRDIAIRDDGSIYFCTSNREPNGVPPFPLESDDRILELVAVSDECEAVVDIPDTIRVSAVPGYPRDFAIPVINQSSCPITMTHFWDEKPEFALRSMQWRVPVVLIPDQHYDMLGTFNPDADSLFENIVNVGYEDDKQFFVTLLGNTDTGVVAAKEPKVTLTTEQGKDVTINLHFFNPGKKSVAISGYELTFPVDGANAEDVFEPGIPSSEVLVPADSMVVPITMHANEFGTYKCILTLNTDSYLQPTVQITLNVRTIVGSVADDTRQLSLRAFPNPLTNHTSIIIPEELVGGQLLIHNALGEQVFSVQATNTIVEWSSSERSGNSHASGAYYVTIRKSTNIGTCVIVVQHP